MKMDFIIGAFVGCLVGGLSVFFGGQQWVSRERESAERVKHQTAKNLSQIKDETAKLFKLYKLFQGLFGSMPYEIEITSMGVKFILTEELAEEEIDIELPYTRKLNDMIIWTIIRRLNGVCSYRRVLAELEPYNQQVKDLGLSKLVISERRINKFLRANMFDPVKAGPVIQLIEENQHHWQDEVIASYVLVPASSKGGETRAMVKLSDIFADKVLASVVNDEPSAHKVKISAANGMLSADIG